MTDDFSTMLCRRPIAGPDGPVRISLHAAWERSHHAAGPIRAIAERPAAFGISRYVEQVAPGPRGWTV